MHACHNTLVETFFAVASSLSWFSPLFVFLPSASPSCGVNREEGSNLLVDDLFVVEPDRQRIWSLAKPDLRRSSIFGEGQFWTNGRWKSPEILFDDFEKNVDCLVPPVTYCFPSLDPPETLSPTVESVPPEIYCSTVDSNPPETYCSTVESNPPETYPLVESNPPETYPRFHPCQSLRDEVDPRSTRFGLFPWFDGAMVL